MFKNIALLFMSIVLLTPIAFAASKAPQQSTKKVIEEVILDPGQDDPSLAGCVNLGTQCEDLDADSNGDTAKVCCDIIYCRFAAFATDCGVHYTSSDF